MCLIDFPDKCPKCEDRNIALLIAKDYSYATWFCKQCHHKFD